MGTIGEKLTHWKKLYNPNYLGAYSLDAGRDLILTISNVREEMVVGTDGKREQCTVMYFAEGVKPMILNVTNAKTISKLTGTPYVEQWTGKKIQLYSAKVNAFGDVVDALRVRPFAPKLESYKCADCGNDVAPTDKLTAQQIAEHTQRMYGRVLCFECGKKAKQAKQAAEAEGDVLGQHDA